MRKPKEREGVVAWCEQTRNGIVIALAVQPNAKHTQVVGEYDGALKIKLAAPPVDGKANETALKWLAEQLNVPRKAVTLLSGMTSRRKSFAIDAAYCTVEQVQAKLLPAATE